jgi:hypothetical protein
MGGPTTGIIKALQGTLHTLQLGYTSFDFLQSFLHNAF